MERKFKVFVISSVAYNKLYEKLQICIRNVQVVVVTVKRTRSHFISSDQFTL